MWLHARYDFDTSQYLCNRCIYRVESLKKPFSNRNCNKPPPKEINIVHWNEELKRPQLTSENENIRPRSPSRDKIGRFISRPKYDDAIIEEAGKGRPIRELAASRDRTLIEKINRKEDIGVTRYKAGKTKGWGVKTTKKFSKGDFVCTYEGLDVSKSEIDEKIKKYKERKVGSYLYEFYLKGNLHFKDATENDYRRGRFINHSKKNSNLKTNKVEIDGKVYLYFTAKLDIPSNREICYDYNDSKSDHKWMKE